MLCLHLPILDHVTELINAIIDKLLLLRVAPLAYKPPEELRGRLLERRVLRVLAKLAYHLQLFLADLIGRDLQALLEEVVDVLLLQPHCHFYYDFVYFESELGRD
jgi:hypothetical protein